LAGVTKQNIQNKIKAKTIEAQAIIDVSGHNKGRKKYLIQAESAFAHWPKARAAWDARESGRLLAEPAGDPPPPAAGAMELAALTDAGRARAWHLAECAAWALQRGMGAVAGRAGYCAALRGGAVDVPDWVRSGAALPAPRTLIGWARRAKAGAAGLADRYARRRSAHFSARPEQWQMALGLLYAKPDAGAARIAEALCARYGAEGPSVSAVRRALARYRSEHADALALVENPDKWKAKYRTAFGSASAGIVRLNQRWEMDSTSVEVLCEGETKRPAALQVLDVYSDRRLIALADTSDAKGVGLLVLRAVREWGLPEEIRLDNGKEYASRLVGELCKVLGVRLLFCDPFCPEQKPHVERGFGTFVRDLVEWLPGYAGHSVAEAAALRARRTFGRGGGAGPAARVSRADLEAFAEEWAAKDYHRLRKKDGRLKGRSPKDLVDAWAAKHEVRRVRDAD
jgi:hypothetical protein